MEECHASTRNGTFVLQSRYLRCIHLSNRSILRRAPFAGPWPWRTHPSIPLICSAHANASRTTRIPKHALYTSGNDGNPTGGVGSISMLLVLMKVA
ncbi:unnamed protein product [Nesidiocoris tenuis]|uniref:Uncharacterized protein n=1 Tax=Nesidiocoris tenuis TaxID=355587 RepID=A0A6H5HTQ3_9HEMI|nr:unnamed protein product [Nesidiocoris tenuis]